MIIFTGRKAIDLKAEEINQMFVGRAGEKNGKRDGTFCIYVKFSNQKIMAIAANMAEGDALDLLKRIAGEWGGGTTFLDLTADITHDEL